MKQSEIARLRTSGDLRKFLSNIALAVAQDEMPIRNAVVAVKACEQINVSLYSEAKIAALMLSHGQQTQPMGQLELHTDNKTIAAQ